MLTDFRNFFVAWFSSKFAMKLFIFIEDLLLSLTVKELGKSVNILRSYGQDCSVWVFDVPPAATFFDSFTICRSQKLISDLFLVDNQIYLSVRVQLHLSCGWFPLLMELHLDRQICVFVLY